MKERKKKIQFKCRISSVRDLNTQHGTMKSRKEEIKRKLCNSEKCVCGQKNVDKK